MEGGEEDMEIDVTMQHDDESIRTESDQFMEDKSELDYEQVPNQESLLVQKTSTPTKQVSNSLPTSTKLVQSI
jgi:hypothetical protein